MCIIFMYLDSKCKKTKYKFILAANRDERFERPSLPADFHGPQNEVLCGTDQKQGVEGGTWLGMNRFGKFSFLTNILKQNLEPDKEPRGFIVRKYLEAAITPRDYIEKHLLGVNFRPFNFVGGTILQDGNLDVCFYGTDDKTTVGLAEGFHSITCTSLHGKWRKQAHGLELFTNVVNKLTVSEEDLINCLFKEVLSDTSCLYPDEEVSKQCKDSLSQDFLSRYCSVQIEGMAYGTVAKTVILIDQDNHVRFVEKSKQGSEWTTRSHQFELSLN